MAMKLVRNWPKASASSLPPLSKEISSRLESPRGLDLPINEECTSVAISPTGLHLIAGFTDGTLRIFDLSGRHHVLPLSPTKADLGDSEEEFSFDSESSSSEDKDDGEDEDNHDHAPPLPRSSGKTTLVCSKSFQKYGAVACQIHAKGVHTSLRMEVDISCDGLYAFGGVARGSMEMVAVDLSQLLFETPPDQNLLDSIEVHRHADAKLRGFGACTRLQYDGPQKYMLLTGKGIKNIHIWSFMPSKNEWLCLYDTQTNGTSINLLSFRYSQTNQLQAISKSDDQKLRVWDLSQEQKEDASTKRPKRPPFKDIPSSESTLGVGGSFALGGRNSSVFLVNLDISGTAFNHTEVAMPGGGRRMGRQQRGDLKSLVDIATMPLDSSHALLEMSDGSVVHFAQGDHLPSLKTLSTFPSQNPTTNRSLCLSKVGASGITVAILASSSNGRGSIALRKLAGPSPKGFWGYSGIAPSFKKRGKRQIEEASPKQTSSPSPSQFKKAKLVSPSQHEQTTHSEMNNSAVITHSPLLKKTPVVSPERSGKFNVKSKTSQHDNGTLETTKPKHSKSPNRGKRTMTTKEVERKTKTLDPKKLEMKRKKELRLDAKTKLHVPFKSSKSSSQSIVNTEAMQEENKPTQTGDSEKKICDASTQRRCHLIIKISSKKLELMRKRESKVEETMVLVASPMSSVNTTTGLSASLAGERKLTSKPNILEDSKKGKSPMSKKSEDSLCFKSAKNLDMKRKEDSTPQRLKGPVQSNASEISANKNVFPKLTSLSCKESPKKDMCSSIPGLQSPENPVVKQERTKTDLKPHQLLKPPTQSGALEISGDNNTNCGLTRSSCNESSKKEAHLSTPTLQSTNNLDLKERKGAKTDSTAHRLLKPQAQYSTAEISRDKNTCPKITTVSCKEFSQGKAGQSIPTLQNPKNLDTNQMKEVKAVLIPHRPTGPERFSATEISGDKNLRSKLVGSNRKGSSKKEVSQSISTLQTTKNLGMKEIKGTKTVSRPHRSNDTEQSSSTIEPSRDKNARPELVAFSRKKSSEKEAKPTSQAASHLDKKQKNRTKTVLSKNPVWPNTADIPLDRNAISDVVALSYNESTKKDAIPTLQIAKNLDMKPKKGTKTVSASQQYIPVRPTTTETSPDKNVKSKTSIIYKGTPKKEKCELRKAEQNERSVKTADPKKATLKRKKELKPNHVETKCKTYVVWAKRSNELPVATQGTNNDTENSGSAKLLSKVINKIEDPVKMLDRKKLDMSRKRELPVETKVELTKKRKRKLNRQLEDNNKEIPQKDYERTHNDQENLKLLIESLGGQLSPKKKATKQHHLKQINGKSAATEFRAKNGHEKVNLSSPSGKAPRKTLKDHHTLIELEPTKPKRDLSPGVTSPGPKPSLRVPPKKSTARVVSPKSSKNKALIVPSVEKTRMCSSKSLHAPVLLTSKLPPIPSVSMFLSGNDANNCPENERIRLALEFRVAHEIIRRNLFLSIDSVISAVHRSPIISSDEARRWGEDSIFRFEEILRNLLTRQELEASTFQSRMAMKGHLLTRQVVSFPFPEVFDQARNHLESFLSRRGRTSPRLHIID